jgi:NAD(P)-dependent dehydrogenase (short-subunit alcohol dehydrogenase family)
MTTTLEPDGICAGRVAVVTGAGRGIGRGEAIELARQGAKVIVNDLGAKTDGTLDGSGPSGSVADSGPAHDVVAEIRAFGGEATANTDDISTWDGAERLVKSAIATYGQLDVLVNNAGILRDRMLVNMTEDEFDSVLRVHLKGTFATTRFAAAHWRDRSKAGEQLDARLINTSSASGIYGNVGQANYGAAKAGIASLTIIASKELGRYGVTANAIAPAARTRMTTDRTRERMGVFGEDEFDPHHPDNVGPLVAWLASPASRGITGRVFNTSGGFIGVSEGWRLGPSVDIHARWDARALDDVVPRLVAEAAPVSEISGRPPATPED